MKIDRQLGAGFSLVLLVAVLLLGLLLWVVGAAERGERLQRMLVDEAELFQELMLAVDRQVKEVGETLLMGEEELEEVAAHRARGARLFERWRRIVAAEPMATTRAERRADLEAVEGRYREIDTGLSRVLDSYRAGAGAIALERFEETVEGAFEQGFRGSLRRVMARERQRVEAALAAQDRHFHGVITLSMLLAAAALGAGFMILLHLRRSVVRPLERLIEAVRAVGRVERIEPLPEHGAEEVARLAGAFNRMARRLDETTVSRDYLEGILQSMSEMLLVFDADGRVRSVNPTVCTRLGYLREQLIGMPLDRLLGEEGGWRAWCRGGGVSGQEQLFTAHDGHRLPVLLSATPFRREVVLVAVDISERKAVEGRLRDSLEEKSVLLREVHHRVKNNMQVIISLLRMQARHLEDEALLGVLAEIGGRVRSMALVHEKLYRTEGLNRIDFADYVRSLAEGVFAERGERGFAVRFALEPVELSIESAVPCGLVLNELLSNVVKHVVPAAGEVRIGLRRLADGRCELSVADDGPGLPPGLDWRDVSTLGLHLVVNMVERQLHGSIELEPRGRQGERGGLSVRVRFQRSD